MTIGTVLRSRLDTRSSDYRANLEQMQALWDQVADQLATVETIGGENYVRRHRQRGKMLPRERIEELVDPTTPFLEISPLAGYGTGEPVGVAVTTGIGVVEGTECVIWASDMTYRGGTMNLWTGLKILRAIEIARVNRMPLLILTESGGGDLPKQADFFTRFGAVFKEMTRLSREGIPVITTVFGLNTAGGAYNVGMSDYSVFVKNQGTAYLGGPPLVKMAINEIVDEETLGGAEMHSRTSGLSDYLAVDEMDALRLVRRIVAHLRWRKLGQDPPNPTTRRSTTRKTCSAAPRRMSRFPSTPARSWPACSTAAASKSSNRSTATN